MFKYGTPESVGIKSENMKKYIETLENANLSTHNVIIVRNNTIVYENYWKPFHKDFLHRMYSVSKSFVGILSGLDEEGRVLIDINGERTTFERKEISKMHTVFDFE